MIDLYRVPAGPELDRLIHERVFKTEVAGDIPNYSTDDQLAQQVFRKLKHEVDSSVVMGKTRSSCQKRYFARYGSTPSTSTEVLTESPPLSICRMALLLLQSLERKG